MARPRASGGTSLTRTPSIRTSPVGDLLEPGDHAQQRRLAAARRADEDDELAVLHVQVDALDDLERFEGFPDVFEFDGGHGSFPISRRRR